MGEISKQRQLNEKIRQGAVRDLGFYEMDFEILISASFNEGDQDYSQFLFKASVLYNASKH
jgi:hypothetical protein